ncbi:hypothetical protein [Christiangramia echinicola]|uniref:Uncharacterized protein n=1 Tax=Christiangramia echinicola TaxID=279359 RepID=A0A1H1RHM7_9FLAO|nr:hypothetical protein [Christiangramia echinicola]SDS35241.1 hypothetical protein SAMN04488552_2899 [Christiangramia echinicola]
MACRTPSVERVADKTAKAKQQIDKLEEMIKAQETSNKVTFFDQIKSHLKSAKIDDARETEYQANIKTEYTSEFSLDKIAGVVTSALKAAKVATDPSNPQASTSPEAIDAYSDVVVSVAEAAKSSSTAAASLAFSMSRLAPGTIVFLYASSINIQDKETFGEEAVTTTAIYYRLIQSEKDIELQGSFDATRTRVAADLETYRRFVALQADLVNQLADGNLTFDEYDKKDELFAKKAAELQKRVKDGSPVDKAYKVMSATDTPISASYELVQAAIKRMSIMGSNYKKIVEKAQARLENGYF